VNIGADLGRRTARHVGASNCCEGN
jgi:hypothetical protein